MPLYTYVDNLLNALVQIANNMGLKKRLYGVPFQKTVVLRSLVCEPQVLYPRCNVCSLVMHHDYMSQVVR
jgi:hypothetical protein